MLPIWKKLYFDLRDDLIESSQQPANLKWCFYLFHAGMQVSFFYRFSKACYVSGFEGLAKACSAFGRFVTGCDVHYKSEIEGGVVFPHGRGIVIGEGVIISSKCYIFHNTTMGALEGKQGFPQLERGVNVYSGTVIAGDIKVGEYSRVGPNVYLTDSIESHTRVSPIKPDLIRKI